MDPELLRDVPQDVLKELDAAYRLCLNGDLVSARARLLRTLTSAAQAATPFALLSAHQLLGHIAYAMDDMFEAYRHHRYVLHGSQVLNLTVGIASATHNLGLVAERKGNVQEARRQIAEALRLYEQIGRDSGANAARTNLARLS
jgi:tetratricopeptide (TPR) repeat protein